MRRAWRIGAAALGLMIAIGVGAQFVRSDGEQRTSAEPAPTAAPTSTDSVDGVSPTASPSPTAPAPAPTPVSIPTPSPVASPVLRSTLTPHPTPTPPTEPSAWAQPVLIGDTLVVYDFSFNRVWIRDQGNASWSSIPLPEVLSHLRCPTVLDSTVTFVASYRGVDAFGFGTLDLASQTLTVTPLPIIDHELGSQASYCEAVSFDGIWALAETNGRSIAFALSNDQCTSFSEHHLALSLSLIHI